MIGICRGWKEKWERKEGQWWLLPRPWVRSFIGVGLDGKLRFWFQF